MERQKPPLATIAMLTLLAAAAVIVIILAPGTLGSYRKMQVELSATPTPTAVVQSMLLVTIDPNNTPAPTPLILKSGTAGDEVTRLQQRLKDLGFYDGDVDGRYGPGSAEAVRLFQAQHGLTADGLAGSETLNAAYAQNAQQFLPTPEPSAAGATPLKKGDKGDAVRAMQESLHALGFYTSAIDGDFGGGTERAVRLFQDQHGLEGDGVATVETLELLNGDTAQPRATPDPAAAPTLVNRENPVPDGYAPAALVNLRNTLPASLVTVKGSEIEGDPTAVAALQTMLEAAEKDGITGFQVSAGYRSVKYQQQLFDQSVNDYLADGRSRASALSATRLTVADPGASEHHTGLAFDMTVAGVSFKGTKQQIWLHEHCWDYGFIIRYQEDKEKITGILAEAWHIRYVGVQHSMAMQARNLCLEEYVDTFS